VPDGLAYEEWPNWRPSSGYGDAKRHFFVMNPPEPEPPEPDMDAIRAARSASSSASSFDLPQDSPIRTMEAMLERFRASMELGYDSWHDGTGYDLDAIRESSDEERRAIEAELILSSRRNWRDIEALAALDTSKAREALRAAMADPDPEVRLAVLRHAPELVPDGERIASLVGALETAEFYGGLTQALDEIAEYGPSGAPPAVLDALLRGALRREGGVAGHFAAMLLFLHGQASEPYDWEHRPFFLRFNNEDSKERQAVFGELCERIGAEVPQFLPPAAG
jgi:hypothetical protein